MESATTPGNFLPSTNSSEAPPPVLTWDNLSAEPLIFLRRATVSPPPATEVDPFYVAAMMLSNIVNEPLAKGSISKTPYGPFQKIVLERAITSLLAATVLGPMSRPSQPSSIPCYSFLVTTFASAANLSAQMKSVGRWILTPLYSALARISGTNYAPSSSYNDPPMFVPFMTLLNVKAMPPPIIISSTMSNKFMIS